MHRGDPGAAIETLQRGVLDAGVGEDRVLRQAWYLRAKACDRLGRFEQAFESATRANAIGAAPFDPHAYASAVDQVMALWTREAMRDFPSSHGDSEVQIGRAHV